MQTYRESKRKEAKLLKLSVDFTNVSPLMHRKTIFCVNSSYMFSQRTCPELTDVDLKITYEYSGEPEGRKKSRKEELHPCFS